MYTSMVASVISRRLHRHHHHHGHGTLVSIPSIIHHCLHWFLSAYIHRRGSWR
uniref:Uncharacterized protein n=1 Tax=Arundo donax TaxID=35708 RepID=A0A0A9P426_ARUDO